MANGSAADRAYQAALREIAKVKDLGGMELVLSGGEFNSLDQIPPEIAEIKELWRLNLSDTKVVNLENLRSASALQTLWLTNTQIEDISPLEGLIDLEILRLSGTKVSDLSPVRKLLNLKALSLSATEVADISPLMGLSYLEDLSLDRSNIEDLRPIADMAFPVGRLFDGLRFDNTPATRLDRKLDALSKIRQDEQRTRETLAYLKTLPPWPERLAWLEYREDKLPQEVSAPLQVVEIDGVLRPYIPPQGLPETSADMARQGWAAMRDFLADLSTIRPRIDNQLPNLARALGRFESALGASFDQVNAIALGTHGQRVIRLSDSAGETLSPDDTAELREFAAAIALYLERFPTWRAYRREALERPLSGEEVRKALPLVGEIVQALDDRIGIDPAIPGVLRDLGRAAHEDPADLVTSHGWLDSLGNVLSALARGLWSAARTTGRSLIGFVRQVGGKVSEKAADKIADTILSSPAVVAAADLFFNKGQVLKAIATAFPEQFGWLANFLRALGMM